MTKADWLDLTEEVFRDVFKDSAVKRTGLAGLTRNIAFLQQGKQGHKKPLLRQERLDCICGCTNGDHFTNHFRVRWTSPCVI